MAPSQQPIIAAYRKTWIDEAKRGFLAPYLSAAPLHDVRSPGPRLAPDSQATVVAAFRLQEAVDYRAAIRSWFLPVRIGGHLVIVVPHAFLHERQLALPSRWDPRQRRLYTPRSLLEEVEEALEPNSYRVRHLTDLDDGYDYALGVEDPPVGRSDIVLILERIEQPRWQPVLVPAERPAKPRPSTPDYAFEPPRTRIEVETRPHPLRILILKLDHMGDLIMALGALRQVRTLFPRAELTLVVGSWNIDIARGLGVADHLIAFDVFPRNSSEEEVDVPAKTALFQAAVIETYDLAIDLRTDWDTRHLLRHVRATLRAGIGTRAQFPFLDIFLPIDFTRNEPETAREYLFDHHRFPAQGSATRTPNRIVSRADTAERDCAIVWGPYFGLRPGRYIFEPNIDVEPGRPGILMLDVAIDTKRVAQYHVTEQSSPRMEFTVERPGAEFEFRIWTVEGEPALDIGFYGGRLIRQGASSVLHQSEYGLLLLQLIAIRLERTGVLAEDAEA